MQVLGKVNSLLSGVDKNAELIGAGLTVWNRKDLLISELQKIVAGNVHMPDLSLLIGNLMVTPEFTSALSLYIGGWIAKGLGVHPLVTKAGSIAQKFGKGAATVIALENTLGYSTNPNPEGQTYPSGYSITTGARSFLRQAPLAPAGYDY